jgi:hypothetical protein
MLGQVKLVGMSWLYQMVIVNKMPQSEGALVGSLFLPLFYVVCLVYVRPTPATFGAPHRAE